MASVRALPAPASTLQGRAHEVENLAAELRDGGRLLVLTGPPGVGKTRLALAVAAHVKDHYRHGVAWADLTAVKDAAVVVDEIVHACGLHDPGALEDRHLLAVVDNCEHVLEAAPAIAALVADHPGLSVLATSRERFRVQAERVHPVSPLAMPGEDADLRQLADNPAIALLLDRAPAYVALSPRTAQPLVEICHRLDGLPLALEFAAARLRVFTPGELAFRLERRTGELTDGARDAPARHRDLRSAIAWSHDLLPASERAAFRRLAVFEGSWTAADAEVVCGAPDVPDVRAALESLLDKSLIRRAEVDRTGPARFDLLVSLREYAAERLEQNGELPAVRDRHVACFADVARTWEGAVGTSEETRAWTLSGLLRPDLETALAAARDPEATLRLQSALGWYWYIRGSPVHAAALDPAPTDLEAASRDAGAAALVAAGVVAFALGDLDRSRERLERGLAWGGDVDRRRTAAATAFLGHLDREVGRHDVAAGHYRAARAIYEELGNERGVAWAACDLGLLLAERGEHEPAEAQLRRALEVFEAMDYPWAVAVAACGLAGVRVEQGDPSGAAALAGTAYALHDEVGDVRGVAQCLEVLAEVALMDGAGATAARLLGVAAVRRQRVAARATAGERARIDRTSIAVATRLGADEAEREIRAGRALGAAAVDHLVVRFARPEPQPAEELLTDRQTEVARLVAAGRTNRQIARALGIAEKTAELHVRNTMQRLGVQNRAGVAAWAAGRRHAGQPL